MASFGWRLPGRLFKQLRFLHVSSFGNSTGADYAANFTQVVLCIHFLVVVDWGYNFFLPVGQSCPSAPKGHAQLSDRESIWLLTSSKLTRSVSKVHPGATLHTIIKGATSCHLCHILLFRASYKSHPNPREGNYIESWRLEVRDCEGSCLNLFTMVQSGWFSNDNSIQMNQPWNHLDQCFFLHDHNSPYTSKSLLIRSCAIFLKISKEQEILITS